MQKRVFISSRARNKVLPGGTRRVFIIHGWGGSPNEPLLKWLKKELKKKKFDVVIPAMPNAESPIIKEWVGKLKAVVGPSDKNIILIGHSIGCQTILRYLEKLPSVARIGGVVFLAPWITLANLESDEEWKIAKPWLETSIKETSVIKHTPKIVAIFSDNDPFVKNENRVIFLKKFGAKIILEKNKGHFLKSDGIKKLPSFLKEIIAIYK